MKGVEINVGSVFCCHFSPEGLEEPPKQRNYPSRVICETSLRGFAESLLPLPLLDFLSLTGQAFFPPAPTTSLLTTYPVSAMFAACCFCIITYLFPLSIMIDSTGWAEAEKHCKMYKSIRMFSSMSLCPEQDLHRYVDIERCGVPAKTHFTGL